MYFKIPSAYLLFFFFIKSFAIINIIIEGKLTPNVAYTEPIIPLVLYPTYVAVLIAKGPGVT